MDNNIGQGLASIGICALGAASIYWSDGSTGIGWACLGLLLIWVA